MLRKDSVKERNSAQFPQSQRKGMNILGSPSVKFVISAYEFMGCSTVNDAKTNKSRNRSGINGDRFLTKRRRRKLLRGKWGGGGCGGMQLGIIFMVF